MTLCQLVTEVCLCREMCQSGGRVHSSPNTDKTLGRFRLRQNKSVQLHNGNIGLVSARVNSQQICCCAFSHWNESVCSGQISILFLFLVLIVDLPWKSSNSTHQTNEQQFVVPIDIETRPKENLVFSPSLTKIVGLCYVSIHEKPPSSSIKFSPLIIFIRRFEYVIRTKEAKHILQKSSLKWSVFNFVKHSFFKRK